MADTTDQSRSRLNLLIEHGLAEHPELLTLWTRIGPQLGPHMSMQAFTRWAEPIPELARRSPALAEDYLSAASIAADLTATEIDCWVKVLKETADHGWKSTHLAHDLLGVSATLLAAGGFESLHRLAQLLAQIADRDVELATSCLESAVDIFSALPPDTLTHFLALAQLVAKFRRGELWQYFQHGIDLFSPFTPAIAGEFAHISSAILRHRETPSISILGEIVDAMRRISVDDRQYWFQQAQRIANLDALAASEFLRAAPRLHQTLSVQNISTWVDRGIACSRDASQQDRSGICQAFFRLESASAGESFADLSQRVEFPQVAQLLQLYGQALAGESAVVKPAGEVPLPRAGANNDSSIDSAVILVPECFDAFETRDENLGAYKACIAHQACRLVFGTRHYTFTPNRNHGGPGMDEGANIALARTLLTIVEDGRIDAIIHSEYPGLVPSLARVKAQAMSSRQSPAKLALRQAFLENLLRATLGSAGTACWPASLIDIMSTAIGVLRIATRASATNGDVVAVARWLNRLVYDIPNIENSACERPWGQLEDDAIPSFDTLPPLPALPRSLLEARAVCDMSDLIIPEYRGRFVPTVDVSDAPLPSAQLNANGSDGLKEDANTSKNNDPTPTAAKDFSSAIGEDLTDTESEEEHKADNAIVWHHYDEWDCRLYGYRTDWCRLGERPIGTDDGSVYAAILSRRHALVGTLRRQFELMRPEYRRKVKNLQDGHDIDLERAIGFLVDKKAGTGPVARFYTRTDKIERDVAAAFLFDMSWSTDETITAQTETKIIDIERDSAVLIIEAMEALGDTYGIFGFSGRGREDVAYYTIKGLDESLCPVVKQRIGGISSLGATRMGAAIRHTRKLLEQTSCAVKLLFLISDGRPQDKEYGDPGTPESYGIHDTRRAFLEAVRAGMKPFVITIDNQGADYLETMCADFGYAVVKDVASLPGRLPVLYRYLAGN